MRIFLSFPSELESQADSIAQSLRNCDHDVFFSHDDLPPGDSFDARVEKAIESSDFMVFLISPGSVTRGRYSLSELAFARNKWPNPSNRVLSVMMASTPLDQVPTYLKAVTILEPQGSAAAETRATVDRMLEAKFEQSRDRSNLPFAVLSLASAVVCTLATTYALNVLQYSFVASDPGGITILPGVIFGAAIATCNVMFGARDRFQLALVVAITTAAWIAAIAAGTVCGAIVRLPTLPGWPVLFGVWQTAFVLAMARGFPRGAAQIPEWLGRSAPALFGSRAAR
ncbi:toll/interleukin-1 receptor domain-containing protein [Bradyrhizobium sp. BEA-2-5]|uniref:toll/interleukin-1 receptor domain-containing protein n=1 Tax=Bradyrhizobium TaxID=374 RepID=UPI00067C938C|nr:MULTISPECIES: toll/interleukin-1 receptor domain-containing protein [Bradyrhizobium]WOH83616.1 toll/interleukin-1 receptor domain-containing protein [Bradyrhizobium sp. BEA-2-5]